MLLPELMSQLDLKCPKGILLFKGIIHWTTSTTTTTTIDHQGTTTTTTTNPQYPQYRPQ